MTTNRVIAATETDPGAPLVSALFKALANNLIAAFEGDATAVAAGVVLKLAALDAGFRTAGGIGSYVWAVRSGQIDVAFGATVAGSALNPTGAFYSLTGTFGIAPGALSSAAALSGTWQCMGQHDGSAPGGSNLLGLGSTLWLRIA